MKWNVLLIVLLSCVGNVLAATFAVPGDASTIQAAIDMAADGDVILVGPGTYVENIDYGQSNIVVQSTNGPEETIIDGDQNGSVVSIMGGQTPAAVLDGFTITNGSGWFNGDENIGGGILIRLGSSPTLTNLIVTDNTVATTSSWSSPAGGGICISFESHPTLENITITDNTANWGGGMAILFGSNPVLRDITIKNNHATTTGGGLAIGENSAPEITRAIIAVNDAGYYGGGIFVYTDSEPILCNLTVYGNMCNSGGGGLISTDQGHPVIINSTFWNNIPDQILLYDDADYEAAEITVAFSDIMNGEAGIGLGSGVLNYEENNLAADPQFVDADSDDFCLRSTSPCIDAGTPVYILDGETLINLSDAEYSGRNPDMGACEYVEIVAIDAGAPGPNSFTLFQNYPNPFNPMTSIPYNLPTSGTVELIVLDILGHKVATLVDTKLAGGQYTAIWNSVDAQGRALPSGLYLYSMTFTGEKGQVHNSIRKLNLLK